VIGTDIVSLGFPLFPCFLVSWPAHSLDVNNDPWEPHDAGLLLAHRAIGEVTSVSLDNQSRRLATTCTGSLGGDRLLVTAMTDEQS
jgi:hypothetical protein